MSTDFFVGKGDTAPIAATTIEDATGPLDLTGASVTFQGRKAGGTGIIGGAAVLLNQTTNKGQVTYSWAGNDSAVPGLYFVQWIVVQNGKTFTVPDDGSDTLFINQFWAGN